MSWQAWVIIVVTFLLVSGVLCYYFRPARVIALDLGRMVLYVVTLPFRLLWWLVQDLRAFGVYLYCTSRHRAEEKVTARPTTKRKPQKR